MNNCLKYIALTGVVIAPCVHAHTATPLRSYSQSQFQSTSLSMQLRSGLAPDSSEIYTTMNASSVWGEGDDFHMDYYQNQWMVGSLWKINSRWAMDLSYQLGWTGNNHLDNLIIEFHDWFNIDQNGRDDVADHQFNIDSDNYNFHLNDFEDERTVSAFSWYTQYQIYQSDEHGLNIGATLYYNDVGSGPFERSTFEQQVQLNYTYLTGKHALFSSLGVSNKDDETFLDKAADEQDVNIHARDMTIDFALGYSYRVAHNHELLAEYHGYQGNLKKVEDFENFTNEITLGYRFSHLNWQLEFALTENFINMDNSADISFNGGFRYFL